MRNVLSLSILLAALPASAHGTYTVVSPTADRDGDGIPDVRDACPDVAGARTDFPETNGCPVTKADAAATAPKPATTPAPVRTAAK